MKNIIIILFLVLLTGCSTPFTTNTKRSAIQQYLLATTIDKLCQNSGMDRYKNKKVYFEYKYLKTQEDENYLRGNLEMFMSKNECLIVDKKEKSDIIIQVICGVLGTDHNTIFIGTPALPVPMPDTSISIVIPQMPLFKLYDRRAYGLLTFNILDSKTEKSIYINQIRASSNYKNWVIMLIPFKSMSFSMEDTKKSDINLDLF